MIRLYTNPLNNPDGYRWVVDAGPATEGVPLKSFRLLGVGAVSMVDPAPQKDQPPAWLEIGGDAEFAITDGNAIIRRRSAATIEFDPIAAKVAVAVEGYPADPVNGLDEAALNKKIHEIVSAVFDANAESTIKAHATRMVNEKLASLLPANPRPRKKLPRTPTQLITPETTADTGTMPADPVKP